MSFRFQNAGSIKFIQIQVQQERDSGLLGETHNHSFKSQCHFQVFKGLITAAAFGGPELLHTKLWKTNQLDEQLRLSGKVLLTSSQILNKPGSLGCSQPGVATTENQLLRMK